jgi:hypothetical protein
MSQEQKDALALASGFMEASGFPDVALLLWRLIPGCEAHTQPGGAFHIPDDENLQ